MLLEEELLGEVMNLLYKVLYKFSLGLCILYL